MKSDNYVLAILDWNLKAGRDGIDVLIEMRNSIVDLRAIILTAHNKGTVASAGYDAGAVGYLTKNPANDLAIRLKEAVNKRKRTKSIKVFLSYKRQDFTVVSNLRKDLSIQGFYAWQDTEEVIVGDFEHRIKNEINNSDFFIACLSPNMINEEGFVQRELKWALKKQEEFPEGGGYIIPIRLVDCKIPDSMRAFQSVDLFEDGDFTKLVKMLLTKNK